MFERVGKKLIQGAKAEIQEKPIQILDTDKLIEWGEIVLEVGLVLLGIFCATRKKTEPTTIVINNYIGNDAQQRHYKLGDGCAMSNNDDCD